VAGAGEQKVELAIHNVAGQRVRTLAGGLQSPAKYLLEWDGRDDLGRRLPAGVYIARLAAGGATVNRRMILVR
jgi:flagellar hook assembly protein FlgD